MQLKEGLKNYWKKFWFLLWKDNSLGGWLFSIIFIFVFIKFVFFPLLSLATGTSLPLAIVESCSMYHKGNLLSDFDSWWDLHEEKYNFFGIRKNDFKEFQLKNGFNKGDILFVIKARPEKLFIGDIIIFDVNQKNPIIHRIVSIKEDNGKRIFSTIGDNNYGQAEFENTITEQQIIGKPVAKVAPYLGWIKLFWFELAKELDKNPRTNFEGFCREN